MDQYHLDAPETGEMLRLLLWRSMQTASHRTGFSASYLVLKASSGTALRCRWIPTTLWQLATRASSALTASSRPRTLRETGPHTLGRTLKRAAPSLPSTTQKREEQELGMPAKTSHLHSTTVDERRDLPPFSWPSLQAHVSRTPC